MIDFLDVPFGVRFIGCWEQRPVTSREEIYEFIEEKMGYNHLGISSCVYKDGKPYLLFLPFDFDAVDLKDAWDDARKLYNKMVDKGLDVVLSYSGNRGFHVYVKTIPKFYTHRQIATIQAMFKDMLELKTLDPNLFGDIRRLMRIPRTIHPKTGKLCTILTFTQGKSIDLDDYVERIRNGDEVYSSQNEYVPREFPCIDKLIKDKNYWYKHHPRGSFQPSQRVRYAWVANLVHKGYSPDEIYEMAEELEWDDFKEDKVRYQIEHISGGDYYPPGCDTLEREGYCIIPNCPYKKLSEDVMDELLGIE